MAVILAVNAGSSSVKVSVFTAEKGGTPSQVAEAQVSGLTAPPAVLRYARGDASVIPHREVGDAVNDQRSAFATILDALIADPDLPVIRRREDVSIICHRIVHGGDFAKPQLIVDHTYSHLEALNDLAPLHNANSLGIIRQCCDWLPHARNVACFDTQFHATIPRHIRTYPIDQAIARSNRLRKYGFHGLSYSFIARSVARHLGRPLRETSIIALHLGSGASACAIRGGRSWDTSMGLTPLAGLPGATRSGSVDPSLVFHYASDVGKLSPASTRDLHISRAEEILNKEAGWKALTGTTDFGKIAAAAAAAAGRSRKRAPEGAENRIAAEEEEVEEEEHDNDEDTRNKRLAFDLFVDRISGFIGSYYVTLRGQVDALVFAGGIGEKSDLLRSAVVDQVSCLGFRLDEEANGAGGGRQENGKEPIVWDIGKEGITPRVLVCKTDEQFEMARLCAEGEEFW
ncbi:hypothetical protein VTJ83DRAFT_2043 [Remersonia thermophila]|uniref:Probable acetate kinase n=1 Tax=Remersonia thermophila TaxID=72144 RepID=A0ABR4DHS7_9PEZI